MSDQRITVEKYDYKGKEYTYSIYSNVNIIKKQTFVNTVANMIVTDDGYQMLLKEKLFYFQLISVFTDIFVDSQAEIAERGFNLQEIVEFIQNTNVVATIAENLDDGVFEELTEAVNLSIEYKTGIHDDPIKQGLNHLVSIIENKINKIDIDSLVGFAKIIKDNPDILSTDKVAEIYSKSDNFKKLISDSSLVEDDKIVNIDVANTTKKPSKAVKKTTTKKSTKKTTKKTTKQAQKAPTE